MPWIYSYRTVLAHMSESLLLIRHVPDISKCRKSLRAGSEWEARKSHSLAWIPAERGGFWMFREREWGTSKHIKVQVYSDSEFGVQTRG
jgi:hypothetical protein